MKPYTDEQLLEHLHESLRSQYDAWDEYLSSITDNALRDMLLSYDWTAEQASKYIWSIVKSYSISGGNDRKRFDESMEEYKFYWWKE